MVSQPSLQLLEIVTLTSLKRCAFFFAIFFSLASCNQIVKGNSGYLMFKSLAKDSSDSHFKPMKYYENDKLLYKDSMFIESKMQLNIHTDTNGKETSSVSIIKYVFVDLPSRSLYEYGSFSDTARLLKHYWLPDTAFKNVTWDYFYTKPSRFGIKTTNLLDTIIEGIKYKRIKNDTSYVMKSGRSRHETTIGYARCDIENIPFDLDGKRSEILNCPLMRIDIIYPNGFIISTQMDVSNKLTTEELKVFAAWEKNAKKNPVQK